MPENIREALKKLTSKEAQEYKVKLDSLDPKKLTYLEELKLEFDKLIKKEKY